MATYTIPVTDNTDVTIHVDRGFQGLHAAGYLTTKHDDGTEDYGHTRDTHYIDYCLTEVVAHEALRVVGNFPRLSDDWNVWEALEGILPECECDEDDDTLLFLTDY